MINQRRRGLATLQATAQAIGSLLLFWTWMTVLLQFRNVSQAVPWESYALYSLLVVLGHFVSLVAPGRKKFNLLEIDIVQNSRISFRQTLNVMLVLTLYLAAAKDGNISRVFLFTWLPLQYGFFLVTNKYVPRAIAGLVFDSKRRHGVLFAGSPRHAPKLKSWVEKRQLYGLEAIGLVTNDQEPANSCCLPIRGNMSHLEDVVRREHPSYLVLAEPPDHPAEARRIADLCERKGIRLLIVNDIAEYLGRPVATIEEDEFNIIALRREPLESPFNRTVKRAFDIAISLPVVVLVLPLLGLVTKLFQMWQSPGPLFYKQSRSGINNCEFTILKFRTMHLNDDEQRQATGADTRIYPFGRWLRRLSLDELPQFINVLQGDMSAVGPRPHLLEHNDLFATQAQHYQVRTFIKPGITGLSQVRGLRGEASQKDLLRARIDTDVYYLENWSLSLDALIVLRTLPHLFIPQPTAC